MRLRLDEDSSHKLVARLVGLWPESTHVAEAGLSGRPNGETRELAQAHGFVIVSTGSDCYDLATAICPPHEVGWHRLWTHPMGDAERPLRREAIRITEFAADSELGVLALDRD